MVSESERVNEMAKELDPEVAKLNEEKKSFKEQQKKENTYGRDQKRA